jgi:hypothetical protein
MNSPAKRSAVTLCPLLLVALAVLVILTASNKGSAEAGQPEALYAGLPSYRDRYAAAVATDGSVVLVGSPGARVGGGYPGTAYAFSFDGTDWSPAPLVPSTSPTNGHLYGTALAVDGPLAVVGAPGTARGRGAAYVFIHTGDDWVPEAVFGPPGEEGFGTAVAVCGEMIVVGAPDAGAGAVFVYTRADGDTDAATEYGWVEQRLTSPSYADGAAFGAAVAVDEDLIAVGAPNEAGGAGTVTLFHNDGNDWLPVTLPSVSGLSGLGSSLALDLPHLIAGAPTSPLGQDDKTITSAGRTLVWTRLEDGGWTDPAEPLAGLWDPQPGTLLGNSVAVFEGTAAVAMEGRFRWGNLTNPFVVVFDIDDPSTAAPWVYSQVASLRVSEQVSVDLAGDLLVVGVPNDDSAQWMNMESLAGFYPALGSAWVFDITAGREP